MIDTMKDKVFDMTFDLLKTEIKDAKEKKLLREFTENYFNEYFNEFDFKDEFDFQSVTEYLLNNYEKIFNGNNPQDEFDAIITGSIARGKGNEHQIKKYCTYFLSFWESIIKANISREKWFLINEIEKYFDNRIQNLYNDLKNLLTTSNVSFYVANNLYADSFTETLFLHKDNLNSKVKLSNLFVIQKYVEIESGKVSLPKNDLITRIEQFIKSKDKRLLFIEGDAGSGKSSLIGYLNYHHRIQDQKTFENHSVVTVRLRDLDRKMISNDKDISSAFLSYLKIKSFDEFDTLFHNAVILLDGFDELCMINDISNYERLIYDLYKRLSANVKIIITSRPKYISVHQINLMNDSLSLCHFDTEKRSEWINNFTAPNKCYEKIDSSIVDYIENIDDGEAIGVCDTPMSLYMLASKKIDENALNNVWQLYHQIFYDELSETEYNKMFPNDKRDYSHRISEYKDLLYQITEEIAYSMYRSNNNKFYITSKELEKIVEKVVHYNKSYTNATIQQLTTKCYALCNYWKINSDYGAVEFYHNNIRDFFLCEKIFRELNTLYRNHQDNPTLLQQKLANKFYKLFCFGSFDTMVCKFLLLRASYDKKSGIEEFPYLEKIYLCLPHVFGALLSDLSNIAFTGKNPIQLVVNLLSSIAQVYRHIYEPYLNKNEKISWWSDVKSVNENKILHYIFHSIFSQVPVTLDYDKALTMASKANFQGLILDHCNLKNIGFQESDLSHANFSNATLTGCDFSNAKLVHTDFSNAIMNYSSLRGAELTQSTFTGTELQGTDLPNGKCSMNQLEQIEMLKDQGIEGLVI